MLKVNNKIVTNFLKIQLLNSKGQTLIETLAAIAILSIVVTAIATSTTTSLSNATYNQNQTLATKYAQQGTEIITEIRDTSYANFLNYGGIYCLGSGQTTLGTVQASCSSTNIGSTFIRSVQITQAGCAANVAKIVVTVAFTNSKCQSGVYCHAETDTSCVSTANPVQSP
jgi:prepilin-type N-terminal cleavage/methylation domain-containing protein